jgi:hypothetical protein
MVGLTEYRLRNRGQQHLIVAELGGVGRMSEITERR